MESEGKAQLKGLRDCEASMTQIMQVQTEEDCGTNTKTFDVISSVESAKQVNITREH